MLMWQRFPHRAVTMQQRTAELQLRKALFFVTIVGKWDKLLEVVEQFTKTSEQQ